MSRRADAQRNYELLLAAAKSIFDEHGAGAPLDDVARRAGVGNATLYRHFPTRRELIVAVYADEVTELCATGEKLLAEVDPAAALFAWLRAFIAHVGTKGELAVAIHDDERRSALFERWHESMRATTAALLTRARRAGAVPTGLTPTDLLALARGISIAAADSHQVDRMLRLLRDGITQK